MIAHLLVSRSHGYSLFHEPSLLTPPHSLPFRWPGSACKKPANGSADGQEQWINYRTRQWRGEKGDGAARVGVHWGTIIKVGYNATLWLITTVVRCLATTLNLHSAFDHQLELCIGHEGGRNRYRCTQRLVVSYDQTCWRTPMAHQKLGQAILLYWIIIEIAYLNVYHLCKSYWPTVSKFTSYVYLTYVQQLIELPEIWPSFQGHRGENVKIQFWANHQDATSRNYRLHISTNEPWSTPRTRSVWPNLSEKIPESHQKSERE